MVDAIIKIEGLQFYGYHGVLKSEQTLGQRFIVDVHLTIDVSKAVSRDEYQHAVCYAAVVDRVAQVVTGPPCRLIETLADKIANDILQGFSMVEAVSIALHKPSAPIKHSFHDVSVTVHQKRWRKVAFSLGSNVGARQDTLREAIASLNLLKDVRVSATSSLYESAPWGALDQPAFLNCCVTAETCRKPLNLLRKCKKIEYALGRQVGRRWGPRVIDIDLLYVEGVTLNEPVLTLPHANLADRAFVLVPLAEIAADVKIAGKSVRQLLNDLPRHDGDVCPWLAPEDDK